MHSHMGSHGRMGTHACMRACMHAPDQRLLECRHRVLQLPLLRKVRLGEGLEVHFVKPAQLACAVQRQAQVLLLAAAAGRCRGWCAARGALRSSRPRHARALEHLRSAQLQLGRNVGPPQALHGAGCGCCFCTRCVCWAQSVCASSPHGVPQVLDPFAEPAWPAAKQTGRASPYTHL
jgi:hypothetical protein